MQCCLAEFSDEPVPRKDRDILDGGIGLAESVEIGVQVFVVDQSDKMIVHDSLEISNAKVISLSPHFDRHLNDVVMPVARGIRTFTEDLEVPVLGKIVIPEFMRRGEFELLAEKNHLQVLRLYCDFPVRIKLQT